MASYASVRFSKCFLAVFGVFLCLLVGGFASIGKYRNAFFSTTNASFLSFASSLEICSTTNSKTFQECALECYFLPGCIRFVFCSETTECFLQDWTVSCDVDCKRCPCFCKGVENVALGADTECSSVYSPRYSCSKAVDGNTGECNWASRSEGVGNWIKINFSRPRILNSARFVQRRRDFERNKDIRLEFSDDSVQLFQLPLHSMGLHWDDIRLKPMETTWVIIRTTSVYTKFHNGWQEIELLAWVDENDRIPFSLPVNYAVSCGI